MQRRTFLQWLPFTAAASAVAVSLLPGSALAALSKLHIGHLRGPYDLHIRDYIGKMRNFDAPHPDDTVLDGAALQLLESTFLRIKRLIHIVGYGRFNLLGLDGAIRTAREYSKVGRFSDAELSFLEELFYSDAAVYGFYGDKPVLRLTDHIRPRDVVKIPYSGNYLYKGAPLATWEAIRKELGDDVVLTSGVRSVMKQFYLFLNKARNSGGNLSLASRSLAPPGYSFHGVGDFDVGQRGFGEANFTARFTQTDVYSELAGLGYLTLRYPQDNMLGVRFEPWHVKVVSI